MKTTKLTKNNLTSLNIYNSHSLAKKAGNFCYVKYVLAENSRLMSRYAYWNFIRFTDNGYRHIEFTITHKEVKQTMLEKAIGYTRKRYGVIINEKDAFGNYHMQGTLEKIANLYADL